jgi:hypothetical protein
MAILSRMQQRGLLKVGDVLIPGDGDLPSFSVTGCAAHADRMLGEMYDDDRAGVKAVLTLCALLPRPLIRGLFAMTERFAQAPAPVGGLMRLANLGIKGVVMTLYYADVDRRGVFAAMRWDPVVHRPADPASPSS